ncbi:MAG: leucyl aminopeptidase family protein [Micrococcales bacterium]|nr:leucyl aminopeptidase family protein [Micrococcales bacterium]
MPDVASDQHRRVPEDLIRPAVVTWEPHPGSVLDALADAQSADLALVVPVASVDDAQAGPLDETGEQALTAVGLDPAAALATHEPSGKAGALTAVSLPPGERGARVVLLVGTGEASTDDLRAAGAAVGRAVAERELVVTGSLAAPGEPGADAAFVEGLTLAAYRTPRWGASGPTRATEATPTVLAAGMDPEVVQRAAVRARATVIARNLGNTPSNIKNPAWVAAQAEALAAETGLTCRVWAEDELARDGFGGLLAVGGGSATPPRFVRLDYQPECGREQDRVVLAGKGITFDTGGLDVKPADGMLAMKTDMLGSAIVLATLAACRELDVAVPVTGLLALAENAISGSSYRPSDVVTHYGGTTSEVRNTDAEGRMVLADALAYADAELAPAALVDIATLTGAARVALARSMAPVYATDDDLRDQLTRAGEIAGERLWPFPLHDGYSVQLESDTADLNHTGPVPSPGGGSITAALFLRRFVGERTWAHLDIAGPGRSDADSGILAKGATAFGTRLLTSWLEGRS